MTRDDLLRKVKGLLAIANGSNYPAEAKTALAKAQAMMLEHGLSQEEAMSKVVCQNCGQCLYECRNRGLGRGKRYWKHAARTLCQHAVPLHRETSRRAWLAFVR